MQPRDYLAASITAASRLSAPLLPEKAAGGLYALDSNLNSNSDSDSDSDSDSNSDSDSDSDLDLDPKSGKSLGAGVRPLQQGFIALIVGGGFLTSTSAVVLVPTATVFVAGIVCMILAPFVGAMQHRIARNKGASRRASAVTNAKAPSTTALTMNRQSDYEGDVCNCRCLRPS